jgi:hypothetical protein
MFQMKYNKQNYFLWKNDTKKRILQKALQQIFQKNSTLFFECFWASHEIITKIINTCLSGTQITMLAMAIYCDDAHMMKHLVKEGRAINVTQSREVSQLYQNQGSRTALGSAATIGNMELVQFLHQEGKAQLNTLMVDGKTTLYFEYDSKDDDAAQYLLQHGANLNAADQEGKMSTINPQSHNYF